jgi:site-specific DNA-methyltransferase (adenine-specific)
MLNYNRFCGDIMIDKKRIESFYDYFDEVADILYHNYQKAYIEGMNEAFNFLLDEEFKGDYSTEDIEKFSILKDKLENTKFEREEVRKAVQLGMLKGYKHSFSSNSLITPDTIGIFIGYILKKLYKSKEINTILDPLVGSGNLVYTVLNHIETNAKVFGVDNDLTKCNLARNLGDLMDYENEMYFQDTFSYLDEGFDLIVTDMPISEETPYFPYQVINHYIDAVNPGGFMISIIENDFFEKKGNDIFKKEIDKKGNIFGLIKLSETLFKTNPKSILIIRKNSKDVLPIKDFLLVDLPSFSELEDFNKTISKIDIWFKSREDDIV